jgi:nucleoid-associated protein YgaU
MKIRFKALLLSLCLAAGPLTAADPWNDQHPKEHVVVKGDTLWGIADMFLKDPWLWPEIWHVNKQIKNPHLIYPGDRLRLVYIDGKQKLTVDRAGETILSDGTVKLSPQIRETPIDTVIPAIPLEAVQSFLSENRVVEKDTLDEAAYVIAGGDKHILMGVGDKFYARGQFDDGVTAYGVYRKGDAYVDPETQEILGYQAIDLGLAKRLELEDDVATLRLLSTKQDIRLGDRLLPTIQRKLDSVFYPKSPEVDIKGQIIHVFGGVRNVSQYNVVVLNRGERDQLALGDVLAVYRQGEKVRDKFTRELVKLPNERSGLLIVFRTFEKVSYGLILKADRVLKVLDEVRNP